MLFKIVFIISFSFKGRCCSERSFGSFTLPMRLVVFETIISLCIQKRSSFVSRLEEIRWLGTLLRKHLFETIVSNFITLHSGTIVLRHREYQAKSLVWGITNFFTTVIIHSWCYSTKSGMLLWEWWSHIEYYEQNVMKWLFKWRWESVANNSYL